MRVLGLIPARGGSKGVPRKNIRLLAGKPLLQYTAEAALASCQLTRIILSTEDEEIAEMGRRCGLDVPFLRPTELSQDATPTLPVVQHALQFLENLGEHYDAVCLLQPTNPLRKTETIDACIELLERHDADTVVTVLPVPAKYNPHWVYFKDAQELLHLSTGDQVPIPRRQELPPAFHREGSVYVTRCEVVMGANSLYGRRMLGYAVDPLRSINIDNLDDWTRAETLLQMQGVDVCAG
jgi:CMP-N,N'-diacetyllegionaminic acid synthase